MLIIYNFTALGMLLFGFIVGALVHSVSFIHGLDVVLGAITMGLADLAYREFIGEGERWKRYISPRAGGHIMFLPVWFWGVLLPFVFR